jgi:hypothetical protein
LETKLAILGPGGAIRRVGFEEADFPAGVLVLRILTLLGIRLDI